MARKLIREGPARDCRKRQRRASAFPGRIAAELENVGGALPRRRTQAMLGGFLGRRDRLPAFFAQVLIAVTDFDVFMTMMRESAQKLRGK